MRGQGTVFRPNIQGRVTQIWWLDYSVRGKRHRESSGVTSKRDALELLRQRIGRRQDGTMSGRPKRVTLNELKSALQRHYVREGNASWPRAEQAFTHLEQFFGVDAKALSITRSAVADYQDSRLSDGAARNTVRYEVGVLSAAFGVAVELDLLAAKPVFKQLAEGDKQSGFFESADFALLVVALPADIASLVRFLRLKGWRRGEGSGLLWSQVDWNDPHYPGDHEAPAAGPNASIRLADTDTKGGDDREFPIGEGPELR
jgi:hypothetical protein